MNLSQTLVWNGTKEMFASIHYLLMNLEDILGDDDIPDKLDILHLPFFVTYTEDNEVYNEHLSSQSYRILLIDKPVEGSYHAIVPSQTGIAALHRKSIDGIFYFFHFT